MFEIHSGLRVCTVESHFSSKILMKYHGKIKCLSSFDTLFLLKMVFVPSTYKFASSLNAYIEGSEQVYMSPSG